MAQSQYTLITQLLRIASQETKRYMKYEVLAVGYFTANIIE